MFSISSKYIASRSTKHCLMLFVIVISLLLATLPSSPAYAATTRLVSKNGVDQGNCTSRSCLTIGYTLNQALADDTITIAAGTYIENLTISKDVTLNGAGKGITFIDGNHAAGVIGIDVGVSVIITGITLQRGNGTPGGAIANSGTLLLSKSEVKENNSLGSPGGGIFNTGTLTLDQSIVTNNQSSRAGGGIYNDGGIVTLTDSDVISNTVAGTDNLSGGGGIYNSGGSMTLTNNSSVTGNKISAAGAHGGGIFLLESSLKMDNNSFIDGNSTQGSGGGIAAYSSTLTLDNSFISNNGAPQGAGGGIFIIYSSSSLTMRQSTISANTAGDFGGGIYNDLSTITLVEDSKVISNTAGLRGGGGIYNNGIATLKNSTISKNTAFQAGGGGIKNIASATLLCDPCTISNNRSAGNGGGIENVSISASTLNNSIVSGNIAGGSGGGIHNGATLQLHNTVVDDNQVEALAETNANGGGIANIGQATIDNQSKIQHNRAIATQSGFASNGAGIIHQGGELTITNSLINNNALEARDRAHIGAGGGIFSYRGLPITIRGTTVISNNIGTGVYIDDGGRAILSDVVINGNQSQNSGGGLFVGANASALLTNAFIENNTAINSGGGIANEGSLTVFDSQIKTNIARSPDPTASVPVVTAVGGGIDNHGILTITGGSISANKLENPIGDGFWSNNDPTIPQAREWGGGIYSQPGSTLVISGTTISEHIVGGDPGFSYGGGLYISKATATLANITVSRNQVFGNGGGIYTENSALTITGSTIDNNYATFANKPNNASCIPAPLDCKYNQGGGIHANAGGTITIVNTTISGNKSDNIAGGIIWHSNEQATLDHVTITNNSAVQGGGIWRNEQQATVHVRGSIIAGNQSFSDSSRSDCAGGQISDGSNIFGIASECSPSNNDLSGTETNPLDPRLGQLANNSGSTRTHALLPGSPAIDAEADIDCPATDQRGVARPQGLHCDIGAFEGSAAVVGLAFNTQPARAHVGESLSAKPVVVALEDQGNGAGFNGVVTLSLIGGTPTAELSGTTSLKAVNGRVTFTDLSINLAGVGYRLVATAAGLAPATSGQFEILAPPPSINTAPPSEVEPNNTLDQANKLFDTLPYSAGLDSDHDARTGFISATTELTTDIDLYRFEIGPKSRVHIRLTGLNGGPNHLPANYDMLLLPASGAESADGTLDLTNIADLARNFIARNFIARNFIARNFIARNFIGDTIGAFSNNSGTQDEEIKNDIFLQNGGTYYLMVYGADEQQSSTTISYRLDIERSKGELPLPPNPAHPISGLLFNGVSAQPDPDIRTIYLYNSKRMGERYLEPSEQPAQNELSNILTFHNALMDAETATGKGKGVAIDLSTALLSTDAHTMTVLYQQWDGKANRDGGVAARTNPLFANEVAREVRYVLDYALTHLYPGTTDIVLVGGDSVIPFYRIPDETNFANESDYRYQLQDTGLLTDTALAGSLSHSFMQTDNFYATRKPLFWRNRGLYVPDLGIGRLVERPSEIVHYLRSYLDSPSSDRFTIDARFATPPNAGAAFVTGYGFLSDQAKDLAEQFGAYGLKNDLAVTPTLGLTYTLTMLNNETWDARQLSDDWLSGQLPLLTATLPYSGPQIHYDLMSLNSHFSHYGAEPALASTAAFSAEQLLNPITKIDTTAFFKKNGRPTLIYSVGCHSGLSATDDAFTNPFYSADFPQSVLKQGGNWIGNTGYAYGDTELVAFSERLSVLFTRAIGRTIPATALPGEDLGAPIGESLARAKWDYLPKGSGGFNVYDEKVVEQMTLYGLPFIRVKVPKPTPPPPPPPSPQEWESKIDTTGLLTRVITITNTFNQLTTGSGDSIPQVNSTVHDSFRSDSVSAIKSEDRITSGQPVLPLLRYDITLPTSNTGLGMPIPRAVRLIQASSNDIPNYNPRVTMIITDTFGKPPKEPPLSPRKKWLPAVPYTFLQTARHAGTADTITTDNLLVTPAQFYARTSKTGMLRQFSRMVFEVTYVVPGYSAASILLGPRMSRAQIISPNRQGIARLRATVLAGQLGLPLQVNALYTTDGVNWQRTLLSLVSRRNGRYEARISAKRGSTIYAFFEARDAFGNSTILSSQH